MKQILLPIQLDQRATFNSYIAGANAEAVAALQSLGMEQGETQLLIYSARTRGKSHLLQAVCHQAAIVGRSAVYLPLAELLNEDEGLLEGLEQLTIVCLDDVDTIAGHARWEEALFHAINRMRSSGTVLAMAAKVAPESMGIALPDLASRLVWGPRYPLHDLADEDLVALILRRAEQCGLILGEDIAVYMISRTRRDPGFLVRLVDRMDEAAVEAQRRLTIPFARQILAEYQQSGYGE